MKHKLTDNERDRIVKLLNLGISTKEIAELLGVSSSTVSYIGQAYRACLEKDFDTLDRLYHHKVKPAVEWAVRFTNTDYVFEPVVNNEPVATTVEESTEAVPNTAILDVLSDIRNLLTEIRDLLK